MSVYPDFMWCITCLILCILAKLIGKILGLRSLLHSNMLTTVFRHLLITLYIVANGLGHPRVTSSDASDSLRYINWRVCRTKWNWLPKQRLKCVIRFKFHRTQFYRTILFSTCNSAKLTTDDNMYTSRHVFSTIAAFTVVTLLQLPRGPVTRH